jgi:hypothetical protein
MTIVKRQDIGRPLTWSELDNYFSQVESLVTDASSAVQVATAQANSAVAASQQAMSSATAAQQSSTNAAASAAVADAAATVKVNEFQDTLETSQGGQIVRNQVPLQDAILRSIEEMSRDRVTVTGFGADPTGTTPSAQAIQRAFDSVSGKIAGSVRGGCVHFPAGNYIVETPLVYTWRASSGLNDLNVRRMTISGDGSANTFLTYTGPSTSPCLTIDGGDVAVADPHLRMGIQGMRVMRDVNTPFLGRGVYFKNISIMQIYDFDVHWFGEGIVFHDVIQVMAGHCQLGANATGMIMGRLSWTNANVYLMQHIMFGGCRDNGVLIDNGANITFDTCSFEGIGRNNSAASDFHAIRYIGAPLEGGLGLIVRNCYFENNNVYSDINIASNATLPGVHIIEGNSIQRTSPTSYSKIHINLSPNNSAGYMQVHLRGNRFKFDGGYTHNAGDGSVVLQTQWVNVVDQGNIFESAQPPQYTGYTVRNYRDHAAAAVRVNSSGAIVAENNVASVTNPSTGLFTVNFRKTMFDDLVIPVATLVGATGTIVIQSMDKTKVQVATYNSSGTLTNGIAFSVAVIGVYDK